MASYTYWRTDEGLAIIGGFARKGLTIAEIAHNIGVARSTLNKWIKNFSDISDAIKKNKEVADIIVENALFKRATGYEIVEQKEELVDNPNTGKKELMVTRRTTKSVPPDTLAQIYWLNNRVKERWSNKPQGDIDTTITVKFDGEAEEYAK